MNRGKEQGEKFTRKQTHTECGLEYDLSQNKSPKESTEPAKKFNKTVPKPRASRRIVFNDEKESDVSKDKNNNASNVGMKVRSTKVVGTQNKPMGKTNKMAKTV